MEDIGRSDFQMPIEPFQDRTMSIRKGNGNESRQKVIIREVRIDEALRKEKIELIIMDRVLLREIIERWVLCEYSACCRILSERPVYKAVV